MPRSVRNSWLDLYVDGRSSIGTGPRGATGEMSARFYVRHENKVARSVTVETAAWRGRLCLRVFAPDGRLILEHVTRRDKTDDHEVYIRLSDGEGNPVQDLPGED